MIVLDTHILIWWLNYPRKLSKKASTAIAKAQKNYDIYVSSMSVWELCMLVEKRKLELKMGVDEWIKRVEDLSYVQFVPVDNEIGILSVKWGKTFHGDPADRIIAATARKLEAHLVTADEKIRSFSSIETIW